jgi:formylglycine-generating enzyme
MFTKFLARIISAVAVVLSVVGFLRADVFNMPEGQKSLEMVTVANPGNIADTAAHSGNPAGQGAVSYTYNIGKYEITNAQWREFLKAKASVGDPYGLYITYMGGTYGGIARGGSGTVGDPYVYSAKGGDANWDNRPVNYVNFWDSIRFCNWLHNGQGNGDTEHGAYENVGDLDTFTRQPGAKYFLPTEDEWYKAAYHKNDGVTANYWDYPTGTDAIPNNGKPGGDTGNTANFWDGDLTVGDPYYSTPVGNFSLSDSSYGTFDQCGNVMELNENSPFSSFGSLRGGDWGSDWDRLSSSYRHGAYPQYGRDMALGFRVAGVPEPSTFILLGIATLGLMAYAWRRRN